MQHRSHNFCEKRRGTTLIEVIAGLVILGTLLATMLVARSRFARQEKLATRRLQAIHALDAQIARWMDGPASAFPISTSGSLTESPNQIWRTRPVNRSSAKLLSAKAVHVEVIDPTEKDPIVAIDLLLHADPTEGASR